MRQHKDSSVIHQKAHLKYNYITQLCLVISFCLVTMSFILNPLMVIICNYTLEF